MKGVSQFGNNYRYDAVDAAFISAMDRHNFCCSINSLSQEILHIFQNQYAKPICYSTILFQIQTGLSQHFLSTVRFVDIHNNKFSFLNGVKLSLDKKKYITFWFC